MGIAAQLIANGVIAGGIYALIALGYTMVYGILRFINFAHGEVFMMGAYLAWFFTYENGFLKYIISPKTITVIATLLLLYQLFKLAKGIYKKEHTKLKTNITFTTIALILAMLTTHYFGQMTVEMIPAVGFFLFWGGACAHGFRDLTKKYTKNTLTIFTGTTVLTLAACTALYLLGSHKIPLIISAMLAIGVSGFLGRSIEKIAYKPLRGKNRLVPLITAIGVSIFLQAVAILIFGASIKTFRSGKIDPGLKIFEGTSFEFVITKIQVGILITCFVMMLALHFYIKYSKTGKAMRATADSLSVSAVVGINTDKIISKTFIIGSMLAAVAGVLIGLDQNITPAMGVSYGITAFAAAVLGGIGNIYGAVIGGFAIGLIENIGIWFIPSGYKGAIAFLVLIIMLLFKPDGLLKGTAEEADRV